MWVDGHDCAVYTHTCKVSILSSSASWVHVHHCLLQMKKVLVFLLQAVVGKLHSQDVCTTSKILHVHLCIVCQMSSQCSMNMFTYRCFTTMQCIFHFAAILRLWNNVIGLECFCTVCLWHLLLNNWITTSFCFQQFMPHSWEFFECCLMATNCKHNKQTAENMSITTVVIYWVVLQVQDRWVFVLIVQWLPSA